MEGLRPISNMDGKDNTSENKERFTSIRNLTEKIVDRTLLQLEREGVFVFPEILKGAEDLSKEQMILQSMNDSFLTGNIMGFIGCGDERMIITSRFSKDDNNDYFFQYLIEKVLDFPNIVDLETDSDQNNRIFNFLLFLLPKYLKIAMRKGLFKKYIRNQYNDENIKGTVGIPRHIDQNAPFIGNIAYNQREFSYDNDLTELIRHTIEFIKKKPFGNNILLKVKDEVKVVIRATPDYKLYDRQKVISRNKKNTIRHAYFREYFALQHLCLLILQYQKHQIGSGDRKIYGILFDGAWLWEEYLSSLIDEFFHHPKKEATVKDCFMEIKG